MKIRRWEFDKKAFNGKLSKAFPAIQTILAIIISPIMLVLSIVVLPFIYIVKFIKGLKS